MKMLAMVAVAMNLLSANSQNVVPDELIINGNFTTNSCSSEACVSSNSNLVRGWTPSPEIQIGFGFSFNKYLGRQRVLDLAPNSNSCIQQEIKGLTKGPYRLKFEYAARTDQKSEDSKFVVKFENKVLKRMTPLDDRIRTQVIDINIENLTSGVLEFCSTGQENDKYGPILKSVSFAQKVGNEMDPDPVIPPIKKSGQNLITNPNFERTACTENSCLYDANRRNAVEGWIPDIYIEVGYGSLYNRFLADQRVLNLGTQPYQCVKQVVRDLSPGLYTLTYEYASRTGSPLTESDFEVSWEGKIVSSISPITDRLQKDTVDIEVKQGNDGILKFCTQGRSNNKGAVIRSVFLTRKKFSQQPPQIESPSIYLDSHSGKCLEKEFKFIGTQVNINFDYNIVSNAAIRNSLVYVIIDGNPIYQISSCSSGRRLEVLVKVEPGNHKLGFCSDGNPNDPPHQIVISGLEIEQKPVCVEGWSKDLVKNGGFQTNKCNPNTDTCRYYRQNIEKSVPNWIASPLVQIGKAAFYNRNAWTKVALSTVSELDGQGNTCIKQRIPEITKGKYQLKFDWAPKINSPLNSNAFSIRINGEVIQSFVPKNTDINQETVEFELQNNPLDPLLEFCGQGRSDNNGASVDNIQLIKYNQCS